MRKKIAICFLGLATVIALHACKVIQPERSYTKTDSLSYKMVPVDVPVKGAKVGAAVNIDSLKAAYKAAYQARIDQYRIDSASAAARGEAPPPLPPEEKQSVTDPETKAQLTYWIDQFGKLQMTCESKDQVVSMLVAEITRLTKEVTKQKELVKEIPGWAVALFGVLGTLLLISLLFNFLLYKRRN